MTSPLPDSFLAHPSPSSAAAAVSSSSPSKPKLTIDDITRLFNIPITEAASILGVSTSVLKRLCRKNGIARWPYRQLQSGKTVEDIKKEAEIEKRRLQKDREEMGKRKADSSKANSAVAIGSFKTMYIILLFILIFLWEMRFAMVLPISLETTTNQFQYPITLKVSFYMVSSILCVCLCYYL